MRNVLLTRACLVAFVALFVSAGCAKEPEDWMGIVYPDRHDLTRHDVVGSFTDLNRCLDVVREEAGPDGAYECGLNCRDEGAMNICERTVGNER